MTENVFKIHGANLEHEPDPDVVEKMEELLADAREGKIRGIAYVLVRTNGIVTNGWVHGEGKGHNLSTGILCLTHDFAQSWSYEG